MGLIQIMLPFKVFLIKYEANRQLLEEKIAQGIIFLSLAFLEISYSRITCSKLKNPLLSQNRITHEKPGLYLKNKKNGGRFKIAD